MTTVRDTGAPALAWGLDGEEDLPVFDTAPPSPDRISALGVLKGRVSRRLSALLGPAMARVARPYVGGETIDDALHVARRLAEEGTPTTLGFWDTPDCTRGQVTAIYAAAVRDLAATTLDSYLSIKPPSLRFDADAAVMLADAARVAGVRLHCDSHGAEAAAASQAMLDAMLDRIGPDLLGTTLPGRWARSPADADWAAERGLAVRVVKGQWPDPAEPGRDLRRGFLEVIDRLAGRVPRVAVATHDRPLAAAAIARLRAAGTPCQLEQLFGLSSRDGAVFAHEHGVTLRIYVPFGKGYVPSAIGLLRRDVRLAWIVARGLTAEWRGVARRHATPVGSRRAR